MSIIQHLKKKATNILKVKNDLRYLNEDKKSLLQFKEGNKLDTIKRIYYLGITQNSNLGDWAQIYCIRKWLNENYPDYEILEFNSSDVLNRFNGFIPKLKQVYKPEDIFVFESGYNINDMGCNHPQMHINIIKNFPNAKILVMPATIFYKSEYNKQKDAEGYRKATNMLFLARDEKTEEIAKEMMPKTPVLLFPDIVTTLIGVNKVPSYNRNGICICCRNDNEKYYSDEEFAKLKKIFQEKGIKVDITDTFIDCPYKEIAPNIITKLNEKIDSFAKYKFIVTDRFHGAVLSLIAGTPVIVLKTNNHKVVKTIKWFKEVYDDYVYYANNFEEVERLAEIIENKKLTHQLSPYFKEHYFDKLKNYAENIFQSH